MELYWPKATPPIELSADEVHVWAVPLESAAASRDELWAILSADERERAGRFRFDDVRRRFVTARAALRMLLGRYAALAPANISFAYEAHGKPRLAAANATAGLCFNLAHSAELALVAVATGCEVGIDVERLRAVRHLEQIARRYFHPAEAATVLAGPPTARQAAFFRCWTGKEAVLKAVGSGLSNSLAAFRVPVDEHAGAWIDFSAPGHSRAARCWLQQLVPCPEYAGAVTCLGAERRLRCLSLAM